MGRRRLRFSSVDIIVCNRSTFLLLLIGAQPLLVYEVMHTSASLWDTPVRNMGRHCREWPAGKTDLEIKLFVQENSNSQDLIVYTDGSVTKDQSGWGFIVKQGATTIHEDCSLYGLNLKFDSGGGSSYPCPPLDGLKRWQSDPIIMPYHPHRFNELVTKSRKKVEWEAEAGMSQWSIACIWPLADLWI